MIKFYDPSGESHFGQATITRTTSVNGGLSLTGEVFAGDDVLTGLDYGWWLNFDNENYVITYKKLSDDTNTIVFDAVQKFFWDFAKVALHSEYNGSHTYDFYLEKLFSGSGYTYNNDANVPAFEKDNWGYKNKLSLFNDIMDQADVEFEVHNETVHIAKQIGSDLTSFVRKGINLSDLTEEMKISDFATYAKGYGAFKDSDDQSKGRLEVEYRSELAKKFGDLEMDPIVDERYTVKDNLIAELKKQVDATYTVSMTMNIYDLENAGYPNYESPKVGDWILAIDEALNFKRKIRIIELEEQFDVTGKRIGYTATCGDLSIIDQYTNIQSSLDSRVQSIQRSVDDVAISADGKSSNYYGAKEPASADDGDLWFDQSNSDPDKWSIKQWANGRWEQLTLNPGEVDAKVSVAKKAVDADIAAANTELAVAKQDVANLQVKLKANDDTQAQLTKDLAANSELITKNKTDVDAALETVNNNLTQAQSDVKKAVSDADQAVANAKSSADASGLATQTANAASDAALAAKNLATSTANSFATVKTQADQAVTDASTAKADANTAKANATQAINDAADAKGQAANALGQASTAISNAQDALDKFNKMSVGGRNLCLNSKMITDAYGISRGAKVTVETFNSDTNMWHIVSAQGNGNGVGIYIGGYGNGKIPNNSDWSYSADIKGTGKILMFGIESSDKKPVVGTIGSAWSRVSQTGHVNEPQTKTIIMYFDTTRSPLDVYIKLPKLEIGNIATDWSPAPEDVQQQFTNIDGELASKVSQTTYNTLAGTVDTVSTLAKQNQSTIGTLATKTSVDTVSKTATTAQTLAQQNANELLNKASSTTVNTLTKRVTTAESTLSQTATKAELGLTQTNVDSLKKTVTSNTAGMTATADAIKLKADSSSVSSLNGRVTNLSGQLDVQADKIAAKVTANDVTGMLNGYATQSWSQGQISASKNEITASVETVNQKVNNMKVGGRNLYLNSKTIEDGYVRLGSVKVTLEPFDSTTNMWHIVAEQGHGGGIFRLNYANDKLPDTTDWTYSADIKGTGKVSAFGIEAGNKNPLIGTVGSEWSRIIQTGHLDNVKQKTLVMYFDATSSPLDVYIKLPKLETGNLPTDWSPAPEDMATQTWTKGQLSVTDGNISASVQKLHDTVTGEISTATTGMATQTWTQGKLDLTSDSLTSQISSVQDGLNTKYTRIEQTLSGVQSTANNAVTQAQLTQTAGSLTSTIDNMHVGGRNLYLNSKTIEDGYGRLGSVKVTLEPFDSTTNMWHIVAPQGSGRLIGIYLYGYANDKIPDSSDWTYSADVKGTGKPVIFGIEAGNKNPVIGTIGSEWSRISQTGHLDNMKDKTLAIYFNTTSPLDVYIKLPKLETGNKATDWSPAAEDIQSQITQTQSMIDARVEKDGVVNAINISPESVLIAGQKVHITGQTTIDNASIQSAAIANLDAAKITSGSISSDRLVTTKLNADNITSGSIAAARIATTALSATNITSGTLDVGKLTVKNLSADLIASGTIDASKITVKNLSASNIIGGELDAGVVNVKNLSASKLTSGTIDASQINVVNLNASNITTGIITGANLKIDLNTGEIMFTKGSIKSTDGSFLIDVDKKEISSFNTGTYDYGLKINQGVINFYQNSTNEKPGSFFSMGGPANSDMFIFSKDDINIMGNNGLFSGSHNPDSPDIIGQRINFRPRSLDLTAAPGYDQSSNTKYNYSSIQMQAWDTDNSHVASFRLHSGNQGSDGVSDYNTLATLEAEKIILSAHTTVWGDFTVTGSKNAAVPTRDGVRAVSAYETAETYFGDIGESNTDENCEAVIPIETLFSDTVNTIDYQYQVFISKYCDDDIWVSERNPTSFTVKSSKPLSKFVWEIKARRRGYENYRLVKSDMEYSELDKINEKEVKLNG